MTGINIRGKILEIICQKSAKFPQPGEHLLPLLQFAEGGQDCQLFHNMASKLVRTNNPENVKLALEKLHTSLAIRNLKIFQKN